MALKKPVPICFLSAPSVLIAGVPSPFTGIWIFSLWTCCYKLEQTSVVTSSGNFFYHCLLDDLEYIFGCLETSFQGRTWLGFVKAKQSVSAPLSLWRGSLQWFFFSFLPWALQALYFVHMLCSYLYKKNKKNGRELPCRFLKKKVHLLNCMDVIPKNGWHKYRFFNTDCNLLFSEGWLVFKIYRNLTFRSVAWMDKLRPPLHRAWRSFPLTIHT